MALITQKYFSHGDSLSSADYNSNVDNWNQSSTKVDGSNIRDQGLDVVNFDSNCCTQIHFQHSLSVEGILKFDAGKINQGAKGLYGFSIPDMLWSSSEPGGASWNDQSVYIFRQDISWYFKMAGVQADISSAAEAQFEFKWYFESDQQYKKEFMTKYIRFAGKQLAMYSGSDNISFSTILTQDMFNNVPQTNVKIYCDVFFTQSYGPHMVFKNGQVHDGTIVWSSDYVKLRIKDYNTSITKYFRAL